jgi:16S rRNA (guanine(966)-N(2))-methyltransferase RsmD
VLDLYAGTGALGIEALSRGAREAVFVENAALALRSLADNIAQLDLRRSTRVLGMSVARALKALVDEEAFDVVFMDPPYEQMTEAMTALEPFAQGPLALTARARIVLEHATRTSPPGLAGFTPRPSRVYGDTSITIYARAETWTEGASLR